jgi:phosphoribosyl 1,2-cyclic phosphate phosphodiesterase
MAKAIILGCGGSSGVPCLHPAFPEGDWGACDPNNPKNFRTRSSLYVEFQGMHILVDTSPELRIQFLHNKVSALDAVIYTHHHADHTAGMDELRTLYFSGKRQRIPIYTDPAIMEKLKADYSYLFTDKEEKTIYPQVVNPHQIRNTFTIGSAVIQSFHQGHGAILSLGLRFGSLAYSTDFNELDDKALTILKDVDTWIVDCAGREGPRPTHNHLALSLEWIKKVNPRRAILTHMGKSLDYETLKKELPPHIEPAYDGMVIEFNDTATPGSESFLNSSQIDA